MRKSFSLSLPPVAFGLASVVISTAGLLLFFLPILGVPVAACGLLLAIAGLFTAAFRDRSNLRWSIVGIVVSCAALAVGLAMNNAPHGHRPGSAVPRLWQSPPNRLYIPPPAAS